jgi:hypothetical protein
MILTSTVTTFTGANQVEWNGYSYFLESDSQVEVNTADTLKITSSYGVHNIELKKTKDQTNFKKELGADQDMFSESEYNSTHRYISNDMDNYGVIVPNDAIKMENGHYVMKDNTEFIEVTGENSMYMISFTTSHQKVS